jgi:hypothetical protein
MYRRIYLTLLAVLVSCCVAGAFENIEVDALYQRQIKDVIQAEFEMALKGLKAQADNLGMQVRERDIEATQTYLIEKAHLMARCVDVAVTQRKTATEKLLAEPNIKRCIETHLKFKQQLKLTGAMSERQCTVNAAIRFDEAGKPYDFLRNKPGTFSRMELDYLVLKSCLEGRTADQKLLDDILRR